MVLLMSSNYVTLREWRLSPTTEESHPLLRRGMFRGVYPEGKRRARHDILQQSFIHQQLRVIDGCSRGAADRVVGKHHKFEIQDGITADASDDGRHASSCQAE